MRRRRFFFFRGNGVAGVRVAEFDSAINGSPLQTDSVLFSNDTQTHTHTHKIKKSIKKQTKLGKTHGSSTRSRKGPRENVRDVPEETGVDFVFAFRFLIL